MGLASSWESAAILVALLLVVLFQICAFYFFGPEALLPAFGASFIIWIIAIIVLGHKRAKRLGHVKPEPRR